MEDGRETIYLPFPLHPVNEVFVFLRTSVDFASVERMVRQVIVGMDPNIGVFDVHPLEHYVNQATLDLRFIAVLMSLFSSITLLVAAVGLYGVISYSVSQRTQEIGIRMALGAQPRDILGLVVSQGLVLTVLGVAIGLVFSLGLTRFLASQLFGVTPNDPVTFGVITLLLVAVALLACLVPARRASQIDPMVALRYE